MAKAAALSIRISEEIKAALEKAAADDHRSVASLVELILSEGLKKRGYMNGGKPKR